MDTLILQVPVDATVKVQAQKMANQIGFSSLQDAVRLFLANLAAGKLSAGFVAAQTPDEILTPAQEKVLTKKYLQVKKDIAVGKGITVSSVDEMMKYLRS